VPHLFKKKPKIDGWYEKKKYPHFDLPLSYKHAQALVSDPQKIPSHSFHPFLAYEKIARRFKGRNNISVKKRPIKYAAHKDGYIYSYYAKKISESYEARVNALGIDKNVIAYRSGKGNNVDFANAAFDEIDRRGSCVAIALDISGFFDHINHQNLKEEWCITIGQSKLPSDHFALFKSLTGYSEVNRDACFARLKEHIPTFDCKNPGAQICDDNDFRRIIKGRGTGIKTLVEKNTKKFGIPQGTAMSALLSNIYMIPFDQAMNKLANEVDGYYRRYSDDILWICDAKHKDIVLKEVDKNLQKRGDSLVRKDEKTDISIFSPTSDKPFQYLGFTYDGKKRLLRSQTLARYWRRMVYATRSVKREADKAKKIGKNGNHFRKKLNLSLTHLGKGNFVTNYAYPAQIKMGEKAAIRKQLSGHLERIDKDLKC
jgi:hypothetical protein